MNLTLDSQVRTALGLGEGYLLDWRIFGCQVVNGYALSKLLTCSHREAIWQCEVIGPHTRHRWSDHLIVHERAGNGWSCRAVGDGELSVRPWGRLTRVGVAR